ncbi:hypothetical protein CSUI_003877 [Cystoisospora suis]|uniref:Uncharacterized protein n=1 Tax=Cystoisospora suis TaxID=483139 RepID=A0A2C6L3W6_9APIC|nr:hypothetical protein CSUI_003877 [Cystoisospora suis]
MGDEHMSLQGSLCRLLLNSASASHVGTATATTAPGSAVSPCQLTSQGAQGAAPVTQYQNPVQQPAAVSGGVPTSRSRSGDGGGGVVVKPFTGESHPSLSGELSRQGRPRTFLPPVSSSTQQPPHDCHVSIHHDHYAPPIPPHPRRPSSPPRQLFEGPQRSHHPGGRYATTTPTHPKGRENFLEGFQGEGEGRYLHPPPHHGGDRRLGEQEREAFLSNFPHSPVSSVVSIAPSSSTSASSPLLPLGSSLINPKPSSLPSVEDPVFSPSHPPTSSSFVRTHTPSIQFAPAPLDHRFVSRDRSACKEDDDGHDERKRRESFVQVTARPSCDDGFTPNKNPLPRKKKSPKGGGSKQQLQETPDNNSSNTRKLSSLPVNTPECGSAILGKTAPLALNDHSRGVCCRNTKRPNPQQSSSSSSFSFSCSPSHPQESPLNVNHSQELIPKSYTNSRSSPEALLSQAPLLAPCDPSPHRHHEKIKNRPYSDKKNLLLLPPSLHASQHSSPSSSSSLSLLASSTPHPTSFLLGVGRDEGRGRGERRRDLDLAIRRTRGQEPPYYPHLQEEEHPHHETRQSFHQPQQATHSLLHKYHNESSSQHVSLASEGGERCHDEDGCFLSSPPPPSESLKGGRDACILVTLPLSLPYGKIVNLIIPAGNGETETASFSHTARGEGGGEGHNNSSSSASSRGGGLKRNYYWFDPRTHPEARKLFSPVAGICDTYAAALHVELAIIHVPESLLPEVASMFLAHANNPSTQQRLAFQTPLSFKCGNLQERSAPCRAGGRVFTLESIFDSPEEQKKLQAIEQFLMGFRTDLENLLASYRAKRPSLPPNSRKPNIWRLSQVANPPPAAAAPAAAGGGAGPSPRGGLRHLLPGVQPRHPRLDVTVRAFGQQSRGGLTLPTRVHSDADCIAEVQASEVRLVTTRSYGRLTNKIDPRFKNAKLNTRCLLLSRPPLGGQPIICRKEFAPQITAEVIPLIIDPKGTTSFDDIDREVLNRLDQIGGECEQRPSDVTGKNGLDETLWKEFHLSPLKPTGVAIKDVDKQLSPTLPPLSPETASPFLRTSDSSPLHRYPRHSLATTATNQSTSLPLLTGWCALNGDSTVISSPDSHSNRITESSPKALPAWSLGGGGNREGQNMCKSIDSCSPSSDICSTRDSGGILSSPGSQGDGTPESRTDDVIMLKMMTGGRRSSLGGLINKGGEGSFMYDVNPQLSSERVMQPMSFHDIRPLLGTNLSTARLPVSNARREGDFGGDNEAPLGLATDTEFTMWKRETADWPTEGIFPQGQPRVGEPLLRQTSLAGSGGNQWGGEQNPNPSPEYIWNLVRDIVRDPPPSTETDHRLPVPNHTVREEGLLEGIGRGGPPAFGEIGYDASANQHPSRHVVSAVVGDRGRHQSRQPQQSPSPSWGGKDNLVAEGLRDDFVRLGVHVSDSSLGSLDARGGRQALHVDRQRAVGSCHGREPVFQAIFSPTTIAEHAEQEVFYPSPQASLHDLLAFVSSKCPSSSGSQQQQGNNSLAH